LVLLDRKLLVALIRFIPADIGDPLLLVGVAWDEEPRGLSAPFEHGVPIISRPVMITVQLTEWLAEL
jgi:hypothetical protein